VFAIVAAMLVAIAPSSASAQSPSRSSSNLAPHPAASRVSALLLSDVHLDPYADPAKVAKLNAAPVSEWPAILGAPASPAQSQDLSALQTACPVRGFDTPNILWQSSLHAIHTDAARARFVTLSGDLLAHSFDCKFKALLPTAAHADYLSFVEKTIRYVVSSLRETLPGVPIYVGLGNNDSGCTDYQLDPTADEFLTLTAKIIEEALPEQDRAGLLATSPAVFASTGSYAAQLAGVPNTRILVLDDLFQSTRYATCGGKPDATGATAQLAWLKAQLADARDHHEHVWVMGHIPPGVDLYGTGRRLMTICAGGTPQMFLGSESLAEILAANADIVRLALFGHTHSDEMRLLTPEVSQPLDGAPAKSAGVPLKIVGSISPVNGNRPTFTLAEINPVSATMDDYTVFMASNLTGVGTTWSPEYTYSTAFHKTAFDSAALTGLIKDFQADPSARSAASQAYLRNYFPGDISSLIQFAWPQYTCAMNHDSPAAFAGCVCATRK